MPTHLVQISDGTRVQVAVVDEPWLRVLSNWRSTYELAQSCVDSGRTLEEYVRLSPLGEAISYDEVYSGRSRWRLTAPIHVPDAPSRVVRVRYLCSYQQWNGKDRLAEEIAVGSVRR